MLRIIFKNPELEVLLIDKGHDVMNRHCPIKDKKIKQCPVHKDREPGCIPACSITDGFGGAELILMVSLILQVSLVVG